METINKLRKLYQLKHVERVGPVGKRQESPAEHTWSALILADYFLNIMNDPTLNRLKIYELIMYHDVVEIECGDVAVDDYEGRKNKVEQEKAAAHLIKEHLPKALGQKFHDLFEEFEAKETPEAKFAKAIDSFDALMHFLDYKSYWGTWSEEKLRRIFGHLKDVPVVNEAFEKIVEYVKKEEYLSN
tara:strand:- start:34775 stop:35332 length:558 start_codon:yes stop_codon:yes gene_type:complete